MVAIETHDLTKQYTELSAAVDDLSLSIPEGVVYGVLGPNGAGKTTMMRMLTTLTKPTSGSARVMGDPITDRLALVEHIGYLPEEPPLFDELSGHEQLDYIRGLRDLPLEPTQERIESLVDALDLEDYIDRRIATTRRGPVRNSPSSRSCYTAPTCFFSMNRQRASIHERPAPSEP